MFAERRRRPAAVRALTGQHGRQLARARRQPQLVALATACLVAACSSGDSTEPTRVLDITPREASIAVGSSTQFSAINATGTVTWSSSNIGIATVVSTGFATAVATGVVTITAEDSRGSATATLTVRQPPTLAISTSSLAFAATGGGAAPADQTVQITDGGDDKIGTVSVASIAYAGGQPTGWLTATLGGTAAPTTLTVRASPATLAAGVYGATISIAAVGATNGAQSIAVQFTVTGATSTATLVLGSTSLSIRQATGSVSAPLTVSVSRGGGGTLTNLTAGVTHQSGAGWLSANLQSTSTPTNVVLTVNATALAVGTYQATVTVAAPGAANSPQTIVVNLSVVWSFAADVYPQIAPYCTSCHFAGGSQPNLSTAALFYANTVGVNTTGGGTYPLAVTHSKRIVAGSAATSYVIDQIRKLPGAHGMPTGATTVPQNVIDRLTQWINQGAPLP